MSQLVEGYKVSTGAWVVMAVLSLVWGSSFILIKKGLLAFTPLQVGSLRITICALAFLPFFILRFRKIPWKRTRYLLIVSLIGSGFPAFLFPIAQTRIDSAVAGLLNSLTPIFTLILGAIFFGTKMTPLKALGTIVGFGGVSLLLLTNHQAENELLIFYASLIILGTMCYAISVNTIKTYLSDVDAITLSGTTFVLVSPAAITYLLFFPPLPDGSPEVYWLSLGSVSLLALFGTFLSTMIFFRLVQKTDALFASMVAYFIPSVAVVWGFIDGELITIWHLLGMLLIVGGVYISRQKSFGPLPSSEDPENQEA